MVLVGRPIEGAQPTSLTQSLWASSFWSSFHWPSSSLQAGSDNQWQLSHKPSAPSAFSLLNNITLLLLKSLKVVKTPKSKHLTLIKLLIILCPIKSVKQLLTSRVWPGCRSLRRRSVWRSWVSVPTADRSDCLELQQEPSSPRYSRSAGQSQRVQEKTQVWKEQHQHSSHVTLHIYRLSKDNN